MNQTNYDKISILFKSSKNYRGVLGIGMLFIFVGAFLVFLGLRFDVVFLLVFGGVFISFSLFFLFYTIPSTLVHYYDVELTKKYGRYKDAYVIEKEIINNSNMISISRKKKLIKEFNYCLIFSFEYKNKRYENSDFVNETIFKKVQVGDVIPIRFLAIKPNKSIIRVRKLTNSLIT